MLQRITFYKYSRDNLAVWSKVKNDVIKLPVDLQGNPNWQYMDQYITWITKYAKNKLLVL